MQHLARQTPIATHVTAYAVRILRATHPNEPETVNMSKRYVRYGGSPRGLQAMILGGRLLALLDGAITWLFATSGRQPFRRFDID